MQTESLNIFSVGCF